eukprot:jgi/Chrzof1/3971/Cz13g15150.t1
MFGSLVICLPQPHTGGALVVKHNGKEHTVNWGDKTDSEAVPAQPSSSPEDKSKGDSKGSEDSVKAGSDDSQTKVHWAAFYSDCEHEILPVESGYRITLTYNLYSSMLEQCLPLKHSLTPSSSPLYSALASAVCDPEVLETGGSLGFACMHAYPHTQEQFCGNIASMLKGADAVVYAVAKALDIPVSVKAVWDVKDYCDFARDQGDQDTLRIGSPSVMKESYCMLGDYGSWDEFDLAQLPGANVPIHWCWHPEQQNKWAMNMVCAHYGNEPSVATFYSAAAIAVHIPGWGSDARAKLVQQLTGASAAGLQTAGCADAAAGDSGSDVEPSTKKACLLGAVE